MPGCRWSLPSENVWSLRTPCLRRWDVSPQALGLSTELYDPLVHYEQVRDSWSGIRTPDGR
jgi:hypothetical protein